MNYSIKPQGDSFLVIQVEPDNPKDRLAERIIAVCGNRGDAEMVGAGLLALKAGFRPMLEVSTVGATADAPVIATGGFPLDSVN